MKLKTIYNRPRIDRLFGQCVNYPLTSVVAGAGYGKTTAAEEFFKKSDLEYLLVTLTSDDTDILWDKVCSGVEKYNKGIADSLRVIASRRLVEYFARCEVRAK